MMAAGKFFIEASLLSGCTAAATENWADEVTRLTSFCFGRVQASGNDKNRGYRNHPVGNKRTEQRALEPYSKLLNGGEFSWGELGVAYTTGILIACSIQP
jgi:hypothetical protein